MIGIEYVAAAVSGAMSPPPGRYPTGSLGTMASSGKVGRGGGGGPGWGLLSPLPRPVAPPSITERLTKKSAARACLRHMLCSHLGKADDKVGSGRPGCDAGWQRAAGRIRNGRAR